MKTTSDIETSQRREQQSRIRRPLVAQVRDGIAKAREGTVDDE